MNSKYSLLPMFVVLVLIISSFGVIAIGNEKQGQKEITLTFSNLSISRENDATILDLQGTNTHLIKNNHYIIPTYLETFTFPKGTMIHDVSCTPKHVYEQEIPYELSVPPRPMFTGLIIEETINENE